MYEALLMHSHDTTFLTHVGQGLWFALYKTVWCGLLTYIWCAICNIKPQKTTNEKALCTQQNKISTNFSVMKCSPVIILAFYATHKLYIHVHASTRTPLARSICYNEVTSLICHRVSITLTSYLLNRLHAPLCLIKCQCLFCSLFSESSGNSWARQEGD